MRKGTVWKALGLAGAAGVVASGVLVVRSERSRRAYSPDEIRERLHQRHARAAASETAAVPLVAERRRPLTAARRALTALRRRRR
ncbi:hypothetical protein FO059_10190 [Tomitella fengzijianii]|uniref:Uncharacterized protein n=1 Tax=Tomitella fengzijianii TaxID=2597660 RepID=A0A516X3I2_9ACTN|nr:hypothetical protein FO059_10190 [Tomitella fengzijianii]